MARLSRSARDRPSGGQARHRPPIGPLRWSIVVVDRDPAVGHEQRGMHRALVVSYEAFHRSGMATICPITTRAPKYPGEIAIPAGQAGQTMAGLVLCHQLRTIDLGRVRAMEIGGQVQRLTDPPTRAEIRAALAHQLGLDLRATFDGAA